MVIVYKGKNSQTGKAANKRFPGITFLDNNKSFEEIKDALIKGQILAILPIWNSHSGEIQESHALELIFFENIKLHEIWPDRIKFECQYKKGKEFRDIKNICSVIVAQYQCSKFIKNNRLTFKESSSTNDAWNDYIRSQDVDSVLVPQDTYKDEASVKFPESDVSNPVNFTTFVLFGNIEKKDWDDSSLKKHCYPDSNNIFGVEMPIPYVTLSEDQTEFFNSLVSGVTNINDVPRVIFVFETEGGNCGLLFESKQATDLSVSLSETGISQEIKVKEFLGKTSRTYGDEINDLVGNEFKDIIKYDFIKHIGVMTCLYACPILNIYIHGYSEEVVELIARTMLDKYFKLFVTDTVQYSKEQRAFFEKYKDSYLNSGTNFITFTQP